MNKAILIGLLGLTVLSSCAHDYKCVCTEPTGNGNKNYDFRANNENDAEAMCAAEEGPAYGYVFTCELE